MKKMIGTAALIAALAAPAYAGGLDPVVENTPIIAPEDIPVGSMGSSGAILPMLLVLGLLGAAASSGT